MRHRRWRCQTAGIDRPWHRCRDDRRLQVMALTVAASMNLPYMLHHLDLRRDDGDLATSFRGHFMQRAPTAMADLLAFGKRIRQRFHRKLGEIRFTFAACFATFIRDCFLFWLRFRRGSHFRFIKQIQLQLIRVRLLARSTEALLLGSGNCSSYHLSFVESSASSRACFVFCCSNFSFCCWSCSRVRDSDDVSIT